MSFSNDNRRIILDLFRSDLDNPIPCEKFVEKCGTAFGKEKFFIDLLVEKMQRERASEIIRSQSLWFGALGWWFARLFMWSALIAAVVGVMAFGRNASDPLTWGLLGGVAYYVIIQIFTPARLTRQKNSLDRTVGDSLERTRNLLLTLEKEL